MVDIKIVAITVVAYPVGKVRGAQDIILPQAHCPRSINKCRVQNNDCRICACAENTFKIKKQYASEFMLSSDFQHQNNDGQLSIAKKRGFASPKRKDDINCCNHSHMAIYIQTGKF